MFTSSACYRHALHRRNSDRSHLPRPNRVCMLPLQIFEYNGSAVVAMAGEQCFAIGSDLRFGVQFQTLATDYKKVYKVRQQLWHRESGST